MDSKQRLESVWIGRDPELLTAMFEFYAPAAALVVDVTCNKRTMWKGARHPGRLICCDIDPEVKPDIVCEYERLPFGDKTVDVLVYDPPHLPLAAASAKSDQQFAARYGLVRSVKGDNVASEFDGFLSEASRVLRDDGLIFAKIKDYVHNHRYQWNLASYNQAAIAAGLTPCDLIIKRDPSGGKMKSSKWQRAHHARNVHCYWAVTRNGRCEPRHSR